MSLSPPPARPHLIIKFKEGYFDNYVEQMAIFGRFPFVVFNFASSSKLRSLPDFEHDLVRFVKKSAHSPKSKRGLIA
jgi:hypothetical protein